MTTDVTHLTTSDARFYLQGTLLSPVSITLQPELLLCTLCVRRWLLLNRLERCARTLHARWVKCAISQEPKLSERMEGKERGRKGRREKSTWKWKLIAAIPLRCELASLWIHSTWWFYFRISKRCFFVHRRTRMWHDIHIPFYLLPQLKLRIFSKTKQAKTRMTVTRKVKIQDRVLRDKNLFISDQHVMIWSQLIQLTFS